MSAAAAAQGPSVVDLVGATRRYRTAAGWATVLDRVDLTVRPGEILGVVGPSGTGKSTLLRVLAGIEEPDAGELRYAGSPAWPRRRGLARYPRPGYVMPVFQDPFASLDPRWPIWRSISEPLRARGHRADDELRAVAVECMARARLGDVDPDSRPDRLSGGQCQRAAILRALVAGPALVVADEPVARQDVITAVAIAELLAGAAERGTAVVVATHDRHWLDRLTDRTMSFSTPSW